MPPALVAPRLRRLKRLQRPPRSCLGRAHRGVRPNQADKRRLWPERSTQGHDRRAAARFVNRRGRQARTPRAARPAPPGSCARDHRAVVRRRRGVARGARRCVARRALRAVQTTMERVRRRPEQRASREGGVGERVPQDGLEAR